MLSHVKEVRRGCRTYRCLLLGGDVRVCIAYSELDDEMENIVKDALERRESIAIGPVHLS